MAYRKNLWLKWDKKLFLRAQGYVGANYYVMMWRRLLFLNHFLNNFLKNFFVNKTCKDIKSYIINININILTFQQWNVILRLDESRTCYIHTQCCDHHTMTSVFPSLSLIVGIGCKLCGGKTSYVNVIHKDNWAQSCIKLWGVNYYFSDFLHFALCSWL